MSAFGLYPEIVDAVLPFSVKVIIAFAPTLYAIIEALYHTLSRKNLGESALGGTPLL